MEIKKIRKEYHAAELRDDQLEANPIILFNKWFEIAVSNEITEVNAMTLATATPSGMPSARIVLLKGFDDRGFVFFTSYEGRKAEELKTNPRAALVIFWKELEKQIRIEGNVEKVTPRESDEYFHSRPPESKMSAIVSKQSHRVSSRIELENRWIQYLKENFDKEINRPDYWGGYRVIPAMLEFWQGRPNRLHDRIRYTREGNDWKIERLQP